MVRLRFSVWLASSDPHIFILLSFVTLSLPTPCFLPEVGVIYVIY